MNVLCIDTSTALGTVALARDGRLATSQQWETSKGHGEVLLETIDAVLHKGGVLRDGIDRIGVCVGPGGFTSVRVGLATAKGIALGLGAEIAGVGSLRVLAHSAKTPASVVRLCVLNAYRGDVYAGAYQLQETNLVQICEPMHGAPADVVRAFAPLLKGVAVNVVGGTNGASALIENAAKREGWRVGDDVKPSAEALVEEVLGRFERSGADSLAALEPDYLRPSDAKLPAQPLRIA